MKKKVLILFIIMITFITKVYAEEIEGWYYDEGKYYYYKDGEKQTGIVEINGEKYYFDELGVQQTGLITIDGKIYYFLDNMMYGYYGVCNNDTGFCKNYYFGSEGYSVTNIIIEENGDKYYIDENGDRYYGFKTIDGNTYYFGPAMKYGLQELWSNNDYQYHYYYFNEEGIMQTGLVTIDGEYYYFNPNGERVYGKVTIDGVTYDVGVDPTYINSLVYENGFYYYYNSEGVLEKDAGIVEINKNGFYGKYFIGQHGTMETGFKSVNGNTYYFDNEMKYGMVEIAEEDNDEVNYYYFNEEGIMQTGFITIGDEECYFDETGKRVFGEVEIDGTTYNFGPNPYYINHMVYNNIKDKSYFYNENGEIAYNAGLIDLSTLTTRYENYGKIFVQEDGSVYKGFKDIDGKTYYFDPLMATGLKTIYTGTNNYQFYFNSDGVMQTGYFNINGEEYYFDDSGKRIFGEVEKDGEPYNIGPNPEYVNTVTYKDGNMYYYNEEGNIGYGAGLVEVEQSYYGAKKYYINESGIATKGFITIDNNTYYFKPEMVTGTYYIYEDGSMGSYNHAARAEYYFNEEGIMQTGLQIIGGITCYFDETGKRQFGTIMIEGTIYDLGKDPYYINNIVENSQTNKYYYYNEDGEIGYNAGFVKVGGYTYYVLEDGSIFEYGFLEIDKNIFQFNNIMVTGKSYEYTADDTYELYFNQDGVMQTGLQLINGEYYFFDDLGIRQYGTITIDGKTYDLGKNANAINRIVYDSKEGKYFYYNKDGELELNNEGIKYINGNRYYINNDGSVHEGFKEIGGKTYYFSIIMIANQIYQVYDAEAQYGEEYYFDEDGVMQTGLIKNKNNNQYYYFNEEGKRQYGTITIDGKTYTISHEEDSMPIVRYDKEKGKFYLLDTLTGNKLNYAGLTETTIYGESSTYYFTEDGYIYTGLKEIDGKYYYFSPSLETKTFIYDDNITGEKNGGVELGVGYGLSYIQKINIHYITDYEVLFPANNFYYFNEEGIMQTGLLEISGDYYYFDETGRIQYGTITIDGETYELSSPQQRGVISSDNKLYFYINHKVVKEEGLYQYYENLVYVLSDGTLYQGFKTIEGKTYYFNPYASIGLTTIEEADYFFNRVGVMQLGNHYIGKELYHFGIDGKKTDDNPEDYKNLVYENGNIYYYLNGNLQRSKFITINNKMYFFSYSDGSMLRNGFFTKAGKTYYADTTTGEIATGFKTINNVTYYFNNSGVMQTGLVTVSGKSYYFDANGKMQKSKFITINNKIYFFSYADGSMQKNGFFTKAGKTYYADKNTGEIYTGLHTIGTTTYYFNNSGVMQTGLVTISGKSYYFDANGKMQKSKFITIDNKLYFFSYADGSMQKNGFFTKAGKTYYADTTTGEIATDFKTINNVTYYFNNSGVMQKGLITVDGKQYYFDANGKMQKSKFITIDNKLYFFSYADGSMQKNGFFTKAGKTYYADTTTGEIAIGFKTINNVTYYFNNSGVMQTGLVTVSGKSYYFDANGKMQKSKFITIDNKLYFFSYADGSMQKNGFFTKAGKTYYADTTTGEIATGTKIVDGKEYTFDNNGVLQK